MPSDDVDGQQPEDDTRCCPVCGGENVAQDDQGEPLPGALWCAVCYRYV